MGWDTCDRKETPDDLTGGAHADFIIVSGVLRGRRPGGNRVTDDVRHQMVALLPRLRRFAYVLTRDMERADDLVQETCVRALSRLDQWEKGSRLDSWLYRIAQNIWFDRMRAAKVRGENTAIDPEFEIEGEDGRNVTENRLALKDVTKAIGTLPPEQQVLIALVCVDGLSYREAAESLQVPIGTVMSRLARARAALHTAMHAPAPAATKVESPRGRTDR